MMNTYTQTFVFDNRQITRIQGHGHIIINLRNGILERCELQIDEKPRYIEAMQNWCPYQHAWQLASRICGNCSISHTLTSIRAIEQALAIRVSSQIRLLRELGYCGEMINSHIYHIFFMVLPDLIGEPSILALGSKSTDIAKQAFKLKEIANQIRTTVAGRNPHPITFTIGGLTRFPSNQSLANLIDQLGELKNYLLETCELLTSFNLPDFTHSTQSFALQEDNGYAWASDNLVNSNNQKWSIQDYHLVYKEYITTHSTAKYVQHNNNPFLVGALARFQINHKYLNSNAQTAAKEFGLQPGCSNPFWIPIAQLVELFHFIQQADEIVQQLLKQGIYIEIPVQPEIFSGEGIAACEAPRGTLIHHFKINNGYITEANCVTPTGQNLAQIESDMRKLVLMMLDQPTQQTQQIIEILVRAYDPCLSCATH